MYFGYDPRDYCILLQIIAHQTSINTDRGHWFFSHDDCWFCELMHEMFQIKENLIVDD